MQNLLLFIQGIELEVATVLDSIRGVASEVSKLHTILNNSRNTFEIFEQKENAKTSIFEPYSITPNNQDLRLLLHAAMDLESEIKLTLALTGIRLDNIRGKVINAKINFSSIKGSEELFISIEKLVAALDFVCATIVSNISKISATVDRLRSS